MPRRPEVIRGRRAGIDQTSFPLLRLALISLLIGGCSPQAVERTGERDQASPPPQSSINAHPLFTAVNAYRREHGLSAVAGSATLTAVAAAHAEDLERHYQRGTECNMHSWSTHGQWTPCCYTADHARADCMWSKPSEFGSGELHPPGYEVVAHYTDPITPAVAIAAWHDSDSHNDMILNRKTWRGMTWSAMGVAMSTHYAVVWFSE